MMTLDPAIRRSVIRPIYVILDIHPKTATPYLTGVRKSISRLEGKGGYASYCLHSGPKGRLYALFQVSRFAAGFNFKLISICPLGL